MTYNSGIYGTYPGKRSDFPLMMNSQDVELHPLDIGTDGSPMRSILRNKNDRDFCDFYDSYGTTSSKMQVHSREIVI